MNEEKNLPVLGITMGDPAGIGPEITALALSDPEIYKDCFPLVIGDTRLLNKAVELLNLRMTFKSINSVNNACFKSSCPEVISLSSIDPDRFTPAVCTREYGIAMLSYINKAIELAMENKIHAVVTAPITKSSLKLADSKFHGHTELFATATKTDNYNMMFLGKKMNIVLVTIHIPLSLVSESISIEKIYKTITTTHQFFKTRMGIAEPCFAIAGLNPHAGENSMFGDQENKIIIPAVQMAARKGMNVSGPFPSDTLFHHALESQKYDCIIAMYHDQGLIPFKMLHFDDGVNTTTGLPIIRTSCDHGTAYDIAWKGIANPGSLIQAVKSAAFQARNNRLDMKTR